MEKKRLLREIKLLNRVLTEQEQEDFWDKLVGVKRYGHVLDLEEYVRMFPNEYQMGLRGESHSPDEFLDSRAYHAYLVGKQQYARMKRLKLIPDVKPKPSEPKLPPGTLPPEVSKQGFERLMGISPQNLAIAMSNRPAEDAIEAMKKLTPEQRGQFVSTYARLNPSQARQVAAAHFRMLADEKVLPQTAKSSILDKFTNLVKTHKVPLTAAGTVAGLSLGAWAAMRLKLQRDLKKAREEGDAEKERQIRAKIRKLNRIATAAGAVGAIGAGLAPIVYNKFKPQA